MILLDTHVWVAWINRDPELRAGHLAAIVDAFPSERLVHAISLWEVSKLIELKRLRLERPFEHWLEEATNSSRVQIVPLDAAVVVECSRLPKPIHRDPMDQIIVAAARVRGCPLATKDRRILAYPHVETIG